MSGVGGAVVGRSDALVLFGATGDLAKKMLYPALYELARAGSLPARVAGVPFYIRTGKRLATTATEVLVEFKHPPRLFFTRSDSEPPHPNHLLFRLKPGERVAVSVQIKRPGEALHSRAVDLAYNYDESQEGPREQAYARLLGDALEGDQRLFARADGVEEAWRIVAPAPQDHSPVTSYQPGSWGPAEADALIAGDGGWHCPDVVVD